jgi:putative ABC transport system permease protein
MLSYQLRLALRSLRRNPLLSALMVAGVALGIGVAMTSVTAHYYLSGNPIPHKSDRLFYVQLDSWNPQSPFDDDDPSEAPYQITHRDMLGIMKSDIPTYQSGMYKTLLTVHPGKERMRPFREVTRMCFSDFFPMFDLPFRYGAGWDAQADLGPEAVVVLGTELNRRLFGGENSVGRSLRIEDREFRVVGVLEPWRPLPNFYDPENDVLDAVEEIFMPFRFGEEWRIRTWGNTSNWKPYGDGYEDFLQSEAVWIQMWVQLDTLEQRERYMDFLDAYAEEQKKSGRFERPINNKLRDVMAMLVELEVVSDQIKAFLIIGVLFLLICSVNLIGILLGKFLARAPEVGVRRALGASRRSVFVQLLVECELIGVVGGMLGLGLSVIGLELLDVLYGSRADLRPDWSMFLAALALSLIAASGAGVYPAWRICRIHPAHHLKIQ